MKKKKQTKCFLSFMYHISFYIVDNLYFIFYILLKKKYWKNFGFFLPKVTNISFNSILYESLVSLHMPIPEGLSKDFIRSRFGRKYFKIFFQFFFGLNFFSKFFNSFFDEMTYLLKIRIKNRFVSRKRSRYFLRFLEFSSHSEEIENFQKTFNFFLSSKLTKKLSVKHSTY